MLGLLDPQRRVIDQHGEGLPPEALIQIDPKIVQPNLAILADLACELAEPEDPSEAAGLDQAALACLSITSGDTSYSRPWSSCRVCAQCPQN
jgi:hypothetical protein